MPYCGHTTKLPRINDASLAAMTRRSGGRMARDKRFAGNDRGAAITRGALPRQRSHPEAASAENTARLRDHGIGTRITRNDGCGSNDGAVADRHARHDAAAGSRPDVVTDDHVSAGLRMTVSICTFEREPYSERVRADPIGSMVA